MTVKYRNLTLNIVLTVIYGYPIMLNIKKK